MNSINKDLVIQEPIESIASWQWRATTAPYESASSWGPRRSQRISKPVSDVYEVYVSKEIQMEGDPTSFEEAMRSVYSSKWQEAMEAEINLMNANDVWDLEEIPNRAKTVGCKWVYKTKCNPKGNVKRYKALFVAKGFTQREWIDYNESFLSSLMQEFFRIKMVLLAHYDLELHQMDVKTVFLNRDLYENINMAQP